MMVKKKDKMSPEGIRIIPPENKIEIIDKNDSAVRIDKEKIEVNERGNLVVGNVNLSISPVSNNGRNFFQKNIWQLTANILLLILSIILVAVLIFFNITSPRDKVSLSISNSEENVTAGAMVSFSFNYKTNEKISNATVDVSWPHDFMIESISPSNLFDYQNNTFNLGDLDSGSTGKIKVNGYVWGEKNEQQMLAFIMRCRECGRDGIISSFFYNIENRALDVSLDISEIVYLNSETEGVLKIKNNTNNNLSNIKLDLGPDMDIRRSDVETINSQLMIGSLYPKEEREIKFWSLFKKEGDINVEPSFSLTLLEKDFSFPCQNIPLNVRKPGLALDISNDQSIVSANQKILYNLNYKNNERGTIKNLKFSFSSANPNFSLQSLGIVSDLKNSSHQGNVITVHDLLEGESGSLSLESYFDQRQINKNQELSLRVDLEYQMNDQLIRYRIDSSGSRLISSVSASASAYYYSPQGDQLGVGPLPPAVNMATNYWVFLEFNNTGNDLENFALSAELPDNVYFSDNKRVLDGRIIYGEIGKRLLWEISEISGISNSYRASFEVTLIPEEGDLGTVPDLLKNIKFTARDKFVDQELSQTLNSITTDLKNDRLSSGKGKVINIR